MKTSHIRYMIDINRNIVFIFDEKKKSGSLGHTSLTILIELSET